MHQFRFGDKGFFENSLSEHIVKSIDTAFYDQKIKCAANLTLRARNPNEIAQVLKKIKKRRSGVN
jgi:hypothetical protein